jgi:hypothetical protein
MTLATKAPAQRVERKPMRRARRRPPTDLRIVTAHREWVALDRADEGDMLTFRSCDKWMNDPSIWEDMVEERIFAERARR